MGQQLTPILINLFAAFVGAAGQYLYKVGAARLKEIPLHQNWQIILGAALFTGVMGLFIWAFRIGGRINITYPVYATTFIWGSLMGILIDKEPWSKFQFLGILLVVLGIGVIAYFAPEN